MGPLICQVFKFLSLDHGELQGVMREELEKQMGDMGIHFRGLRAGATRQYRSTSIY